MSDRMSAGVARNKYLKQRYWWWGKVLDDKNTPAPGSTDSPCAGGDENAMSMPAGDGSWGGVFHGSHQDEGNCWELPRKGHLLWWFILSHVWWLANGLWWFMMSYLDHFRTLWLDHAIIQHPVWLRTHGHLSRKWSTQSWRFPHISTMRSVSPPRMPAPSPGWTSCASSTNPPRRPIAYGLDKKTDAWSEKPGIAPDLAKIR